MSSRQKQPVRHPLGGTLQQYGQGNQRQGLVFLSRNFQVASSTAKTKPCHYLAGPSDAANQAYSHSIVAGGLPLTSYTTRLMPLISLMMRLDTLPKSE